MASEELAFLHRYRDVILRRWKENIRQSVNPDFFSGDSLVTDDLLAAIFTYILDALDQNHFHDLNRTFDTLVDRAYAKHISIKDVTGLLFGFIHATEVTLDTDAAASRSYDYLKKTLGRFSRDLRNVYSERIGRQAADIMFSRKDHILAKWQRDIPTEAVSTHFSVLSRDETMALVSATFEMAVHMLLGTEDQPSDVIDEVGKPKSRLLAYLDDQTDFFEPRGFAISSIERAIMHLEEIAEPILFDRLQWHASDYRKALWVLRSAMKRLALAFSEHYNQRMMNNYYEEVSKMLHRIKNKITPAQTGLQTILPVEFDGRVQEGMLMTPDEAQVLQSACEANNALLAAAERAAQAVKSGGDAQAAAAELRTAAQAAQALAPELELIRSKLDMVDLVEEFIRDALEAAELSTDLAKDLQEVQNELIRREPPVWESVCINDLVQRAFDESQVDAKQRGLDYILDMDSERGYVFAIERQLTLPLAQVISNAIKYTPAAPGSPESGANGNGNGNGIGNPGHRSEDATIDTAEHRVLVTLTVNPDSVLFSCQDSGIGIPPGEEELVFALCERCSNAKEFNKHGSGTGLYHDRKIVEQHNGKIWVESKGADQGSTFYVKLPRYQAEQHAAKAA